MPGDFVLRVTDGKLIESINSFLRNLLERKLVDALLVPLELPSKNMAAPALVSDREMLKYANPLAPVMPVSTARVVSRLTKVATSKRKIGVALRSCELRALVELIKLKQASLENLILICIDCFGTYSVADYSELCQETTTPTEDFLTGIKTGSDSRLREACQVCQYPSPVNADLTIGLIGMDLKSEILVQAASPEGEHILEVLGLNKCPEGMTGKRKAAISELVAVRTDNKDKLFRQVQKESTGLENLLAMLASCINCHNCRIACPLCYCRECFFDSPTFEWEADKYLNWADKKGAIRMPADSLLFHLTRLNHMVASCVGCGLCQDACPNDIPVFRIFRMVGEEVQKTFGYVPGRSLEEELPLSVFREDELGEVGL